jgi:hypothetical protein
LGPGVRRDDEEIAAHAVVPAEAGTMEKQRAAFRSKSGN